MSVFVYDPTVQDTLSKVRGVGRYLQLLHAAFDNEYRFITRLSDILRDATFINPFFNFLQPPLHLTRVAQKQIAVIHDLIPLKYPDHFPIGMKGQLSVFLNRLSLRTYDRIVTGSETNKHDIIKILGITPEKIQVIYPVLPDVFFQTSQAPSAERYAQDYFIYVGDATWNKNLVNIARAVQNTNITCMFVGKVFADLGHPAGVASPEPTEGINEQHTPLDLSHPWQQELRHFVEISQDDKRFIFPGYVSDKKLTSLYKNAVANILISRDEGFGFSYFEAASQKTPSVLADRPIFHETAANTALFVDPEDPEALATVLKTLLNDRTLRTTLARKAYERTKNFTLQSFQKQWIMTLNQI